MPRQQRVAKVARPLLMASGRALRCRDLPVFSCNTAASRRLDPDPNPRRIDARDFNHGLRGAEAGPASAAELSKRFKEAKADRVGELLATLTALGQARSVGGERFVA